MISSLKLLFQLLKKIHTHMEQIGKEKGRTESVNFREKERINQILGEKHNLWKR